MDNPNAKTPPADKETLSYYTRSQANLHRKAADLRIGNLLITAGIIQQDQYDTARHKQSEEGGDIVNILLSLGFLDPAALVEVILTQPDASETAALNLELDSETIQLLPAELAQKHQIVPLEQQGSVLVLGAIRPLAPSVMEDIHHVTQLIPKIIICPKKDVEVALNAYYGTPDAEATATASLEDNASEKLQANTKLNHAVHMIQQITSLPALPETVARVKERTEDPESTVQEIVDIITLDPPIAAKILSVANSAAYGFRHKITDLKSAVALLGLRETYEIVLSAAVLNITDTFSTFDHKAFWLESMCSAAAARIVAKATGLRRLSGVFSAALLHDIGRVVLAELHSNYNQIFSSPCWGRELVEREEAIIGLSHPEAGYELATHWNLPPEIAEPIRCHHAPEGAIEAPQQVAIVALANVMACNPASQFEEGAPLFEGYEHALKVLNLDEEIAEAVMDEFLTVRTNALNANFEA